MNATLARGRRFTLTAVLGMLAVLLMSTVMPASAANPAPVQTYFITEPEDDVLDAMNIINSAANSPMVSKGSIAIRFNGTYVYYDHWEDGFANDIANPTAGEIYANPGNLDGVQIWGNGIAADGCAPQIGSTPVVCTNANDVLDAGDVIILDDPDIEVPNLASTIDWDGKDKIGASAVVAVSRSLWASNSNSLFAWANSMFPTSDWGQEYTSPVGCDTTTNAGAMFEYTGFSITAAYDDTVIEVDPEGNGTWEAQVTLDEGETYYDDSSSGFGCDYIRQGGKVRSTDPAKPIQVVILTGDIGSSYASRDLNLYPDASLTSSYWIPVGNDSGSSGDPGDVRLFIYNPSSTNLYVRCESPSTATTYTIAPDSVNSSFTLENNEAGHCFAVTAAGGTTPDPSRQFSGLATVDTAASGWDWALPFIPEQLLSNQALVGLGEGRDWTSNQSLTQNGSPLWVTPVCQTFFYVDWNNDGTPDKVDFNGDNDVTDANVNGLDETTSDQGFQVNALQSVRLRDASDRDQTGAYIYTRTAANGGGTGGCSFAGAWGEDPRVASVGSPGLDLGTIIINLKAVETSKASTLLIDNDNNGVVSPGDTIRYLISIKNTGLIPIAISVQDDIPTYTSYVLNTTEKDVGGGWVSIPDDGSGTPFPLDDPLPDGVSLGNLPVGDTWLVRFEVTVDLIPAGQTVQLQNCARIAYGDKNTTTCVTEDVFVPPVPEITVTKTASPTSVPETGGNVTFTYVVQNTGTVPVTITELSDDKFGTLAGDGDCQVGTVIAVGGSCTFDAIFAVPAGVAGGTHTNIFTAKAEDDDGNEGSDDDPEDVTYTDVLPSIIVDKTANPTSVPEAGGPVTFTYVVTNNGTVPVTITSLVDDKFGTLVGDSDCQVGTVIPAGGFCTFDAIFNVPPGTYPGSHVNVFTAQAVDNEQNMVQDDDPAEVFYQEPPVTNVCPVDAAAHRWTDIIGIGMGAPNKHKNVAKINIPNSGDVLALYGQLAAKDQGLAKYVRFMYPGGSNNYVQVNAITSPSPHSAAVFWYGTDLDPAANIRGRWFLQKSGVKAHIPRAMILYPTYETDELYVDVFEPLQTSDTQVYWDINGGWVPMQQVTINIPAPLAPATINVKVAVVDNDKDGRPLFVTATAGGVSQTLQPTNPNRGDQLNILEFTLANVPAGTSSIVLTHESIAPNTNSVFPLGGDSGALVGVTASYFCADVP